MCVCARVKWLFFCSNGGERGREGEEKRREEKAKAIICSVYVYTSQHEKSSCFYVSRVVSLIICLMLTFTYICFSDDICFLSNMMMINSPPPSSQSKTQTDSAKRLRLTIPRNNKTDLLTNSNQISPSKIDEKTNHIQQKSIDCNNTMTTMKQQLSTSIDNENDTTLLTTTTTTTTVEVKVKTTKTSSSSSSSRKRKLNVVDETINTTNNNNDDNISKQQQQAVSKKKVIYKEYN